MNCILHIGIEKTGTTSIQEFFVSNEDILLNQNYKITHSLGTINNSGLVQIANKNKLSKYVKDIRGLDDKSYELFLKKRIQSFEKEIINTKWPTDNKNILMSSEHLQSHLEKSEIRNLKLALQNLGFDSFRIVLVLRPQSEVILSRISTGVIARNYYSFLSNTNVIELPRHYLRNSRLYNYKKTINIWSEVFGINNILVLDFNKIRKPSLEINFLKEIDKNIDVRNFKQIQIKNISLPFEIILALNKFNKEHKLDNKQMVSLVKNLRLMEVCKVDYSLSRKTIEHINSDFCDENKEIQEKYGINLANNYKKIDLQEINIDKSYESILNFCKRSL